MKQKSRLWRAMYNAKSQPCIKQFSIKQFMETFNKTISNFQTKPYEIMQDNIEFLQNDNNKQETQQQTGSNTSFFDSSEKDVNQLNKNIIFKNQANQGYNNCSIML